MAVARVFFNDSEKRTAGCVFPCNQANTNLFNGAYPPYCGENWWSNFDPVLNIYSYKVIRGLLHSTAPLHLKQSQFV